jgi:hypothetical protein
MRHSGQSIKELTGAAASAYTSNAAPTLSGGRPSSSLPAVGGGAVGSAGVWTTCTSEWSIRSVAAVDNRGRHEC